MSKGEAPSHLSATVATEGPVLIVGTGLIGTSIALGLQADGVEVYLSDPSPTSLALAADMGAGKVLEHYPDARPRIVVIAAPPDVAAACIVDALQKYPEALVTDVASVKVSISDAVLAMAPAASADVSRYVGSHPMAGRERSGASLADRDLFYGQPWVIVPHASTRPEATLAIRTLATDLGAVPTEMSPLEHDKAVAYISHVPQLVSSLLAGRVLDAPGAALSLSGQGLRDTTRIAASDPRLWTAIIAGNAGPIAAVLEDFSDDLTHLVERLNDYAESSQTQELAAGGLSRGTIGVISEALTAGNRGVSRIPGKHGQAPRRWAELEVLVPDEAGELGRLFTELGAAGINIEDLSLEHSSGQKVGLARLMIDPAYLIQAVDELELRGWRIVNAGEQL